MHELKLKFLRGNAPDTGCLSLPPAFKWFGLVIYDEIGCEGEGYCRRSVVGVGGEGVVVCVVVVLKEEREGGGVASGNDAHGRRVQILGCARPVCWANVRSCGEPITRLFRCFGDS